MAATIEPGQSFKIEYGNNKTIDVIALAGTKQQRLARVVKELADLEQTGNGLDLFDLALRALEICIGGGDSQDNETPTRKRKRIAANAKALELYDQQLDAQLAIEIAGKCLSKTQLDDEAKKKSGSRR